jgi:hypothetical protein
MTDTIVNSLVTPRPETIRIPGVGIFYTDSIAAALHVSEPDENGKWAVSVFLPTEVTIWLNNEVKMKEVYDIFDNAIEANFEKEAWARASSEGKTTGFARIAWLDPEGNLIATPERYKRGEQK